MDISQLVEYLGNREFSLFLGAGASVSAGGPTGSELLREIQKKYPIIGEEKDFFRALDKVLSPDNAERVAVEEFVRSILTSITPTNLHHYLFSIPWRAILTTNYDRIPELIDTTLDGNRVIFTLVEPQTGTDFRRDDRLYCLKLFGDMSVSYPHEGHMVLTNTDRRRAYSKQAVFFKQFRDLARSGIIVYLGYSFEDELVFDILDDMLFELKNFPHRGFAIIPNKPPEAILDKMKRYNIEWVQGKLEDFIAESKSLFGDIPKSCSISLFPIKVHGRIIELNRSTFSNIRGKVRVLHQGLFTVDQREPKLFLEGKDQSFVPFQESWDFPRRWNLQHCGERAKAEWFKNVEELVKSRSKTGNPADNLVFALIGCAGSGKSTVAKRIAYDWYMNGNPVLFLDSSNVFLDTTAIESLLDEIWDKYRKQIGTELTVKEVRYLVVCDNGSLLLSQIAQLANQLMSAGKPVDILIVDRSSELPEVLLKEMGIDAILALEDTITFDDRQYFIEHFEKMGVLPDMSALRANLSNPEINKSFFALLYTSIREVQVPLKEIIIKEFESKSYEMRRLYAIVSLVQSYGLHAYYTITTKACDMNFESALNLMESGQLRDVLSFDPEEQSIKANHRIIADIIRDYVFSTTDLLRNGLSKVIDVVTNGNIPEMQLVHKLLIDCTEINRRLSPEQLENLYILATERIKTRPLLLHLARTQLRMQKYDECRASLGYAAKTQHPVFYEPLDHVFDVQGRLELSIARDYLDKRKEAEAWAHLEQAEASFMQAQVNPIATPHPYLGLAQTYSEMAKLQTQRPQKMNLSILSLNVLEELRNNSPEWFTLTRALELERSIFSNLVDSGFSEKDADILFQVSHHANGYAFLAQREAEAGNEKIAFELVNKGLELDKRSIWLMRIKVELIKKLAPEDYDEIYETLLEYQKQQEQAFDLRLAYELARLQFIKGEWTLSKQLFTELGRKSKGYRYRLIPSETDRWVEKGEPKKLSGIIVKPPTIEEWGALRSHKPPIPYLIPVRYQDMQYERYQRGDKVEFEIVFNMVGPQASKITPR